MGALWLTPYMWSNHCHNRLLSIKTSYGALWSTHICDLVIGRMTSKLTHYGKKSIVTNWRVLYWEEIFNLVWSQPKCLGRQVLSDVLYSSTVFNHLEEDHSPIQTYLLSTSDCVSLVNLIDGTGSNWSDMMRFIRYESKNRFHLPSIKNI